jgi:putative toxin-antitoxin system antitoxin component (TIGR02293 family)
MAKMVFRREHDMLGETKKNHLVPVRVDAELAVPRPSLVAASVDELLGIRADNPLELLRSINRGFSFHVLEKVKRKTGLPMESLATAIGISQRTLSRRKKEKKLSSTESDRLISVSRIFSLAVDLFEGNDEKAMNWLTSRNRALGDFSPLVMAQTETGSREVEDLIGRLEHGVFT